MYTTRPLSLFKSSPEAMSLPPEGPNSGYLVLRDEKSILTCNLGSCKDPSINDLPFPQNMRLIIECHDNCGDPTGDNDHYDEVCLIPIINEPLSSNQYYAVKASGRHKGKSYVSSRDQDEATCCICFPRDVKPISFDPEDIYQKFEFSVTKTYLNNNKLLAKSVAPEGIPPFFLCREGWQMTNIPQSNFTLGEARGLNSSLRTQLPDFSFPTSQECSKSVVVGKWYCPFMFIKEGKEKDQLKKSMFYKMTLEQHWEQIFGADRSHTHGKVVEVNVKVPTELIRISGQETVQEETNEDDRRVVWFKNTDGRGKKEKVGMSTLIVERMMWEEERVGWIKEKEKHATVIKEEEYEGIKDWKRYGCYVLVETFVLKRNDGSIVLTYEFKHTHQLRSKWE